MKFTQCRAGCHLYKIGRYVNSSTLEWDVILLDLGWDLSLLSVVRGDVDLLRLDQDVNLPRHGLDATHGPLSEPPAFSEMMACRIDTDYRSRNIDALAICVATCELRG